MDVLYTHCAGIDGHKQTAVVCYRTTAVDGTVTVETRTCSTMTAELLARSDWLTSLAITHVAMERTGEFWKPLYQVLEANFTGLVVNAQPIKTVPGRKTDVKDAEWLADLLRHGLLRGSFAQRAPAPVPQRDLRDLTRQRTILVRARATVVNRLPQVLAWANLKLAAVATDVLGVSARAMREALVAGQSDVTTVAAVAQGRMRSKRAELERAGRARPGPSPLLACQAAHAD